MSEFMDRVRRSRAAAQSATPAPVSSSFMDRVRAGRGEQHHGPTNPNDYVRRAAARLEAMGASEGDVPNLRARILNEEWMKDGGRDMLANDSRRRGMESYMKKHPVADFAAGVTESLGSTGESLVGLYAPKFANRLATTRRAYSGTPQGVAGLGGSVLGMAGVMAAAVAGGGVAVTAGLFAQQGGGGVRQNIAVQRAAGREISAMDEWIAVYAVAALEGGSGALSVGMAQKFGKIQQVAKAQKLAKLLKDGGPALREAIRNGGKKAGVARLTALLTHSGIEFTEESLTQLATNGVDLMLDITPGLRITEGALEAGVMGAGLAPFLSGVSAHGLKLRHAAAGRGSPAVPGLIPNDSGMDSAVIADPLKAAEPAEDRMGTQAPVRPNGRAYEQTKMMYVEAQNERALSRADRAVSKVAEGDASVEEALYKGLNIAPPTGEQTGYQDHLTRIEIMRKSKSKPKTLESNKTVAAVASRLRAADSSLSVEAAQAKAEGMIAKVAKFTRTIRLEDAALAHHERQYNIAVSEGKAVPQAVRDEYRPAPIADTDQQIDERIDLWDNDAWGDDPVTFGDNPGIDTREQHEAGDVEESHTWKVRDLPDGSHVIENEAGEVIDGPFDTMGEADSTLDAYQEEGGTKDGPPEREVGRIDGWTYTPDSPKPPAPPADGGPADADPTGPQPGSRERPNFVIKLGQDVFTPISSVIKQINPLVFGRLMRYETMVRSDTVQAMSIVSRWGKAKNRAFFGRFAWKKVGARKASRELSQAFDLATANGDMDTARRILKDSGATRTEQAQLLRGFANVQRLLDQLHAAQVAAGLDVGKLPDYFPRAVKDHEEYLAFVGREEKSKITKKIEAAQAKDESTPLTDEQKTDIVNEHLQGYGEQFREQSVRHGAQRTVAEIQPENHHLYERGDIAIMQYIRRTVEGIHTAKFFGKKKKASDTTHDTIGQFVQRELELGHITEAQQDRLSDLIRSRFVGGQRSPSKGWRLVRDMGYLTVLANPIAAATQLGDIVLSVLSNGGISTAVGVYQAFRPGHLTPAQLGIVQATAEFGTPSGLHNILDWSLTLSLFKTVDTFGKQVNMNAAMRNFTKAVAGQGSFTSVETASGRSTTQVGQTAAYKEFAKEWQPILGDEYQQAVSDLRSGIVSDNVRMMIFTNLSKTQPISLSEMPKKYLDQTNGRLFYMLKSFTLKQLDFAKQRSIDKIVKAGKTGDARLMTEGVRGLTSYAILFAAANFNVDLLKDLILGKEIDQSLVEDEAIDNIWKLFGMSTYTAESVATDGLLDAAFNFVMPPVAYASDIAVDIKSLFDPEKEFEARMTRNIPVIGRLYYYRLGHGVEDNIKAQKKRHNKRRSEAQAAAKVAYLDGSRNSARAIINSYNDDLPDDMKKLSMKIIGNSIRRDKKKAREEAREEARK